MVWLCRSERVLKTYKRGEISYSAVIMRFVAKECNHGPQISFLPVSIKEDDDADSLGARFNRYEYD